MGFRGPTGLIGSSPKDPIVVRSHKLYQIRLWSHYRGWSQLVCSIPTLGSVREQAVAQEGAEGLAGVGFLLALAEAAQLSGTSPQRVVEVATGALLGV